MTVHIGSIPPNIVIFPRPPKKFGTRWDDLKDDIGEVITVTPAFVTDPTNKGRVDTAKRWADWDDDQPLPDLIPNTGFRVKVIGLEHRNEGGRAWKVIFSGQDEWGENFLVDLREDVLLEVLRTVGTKPNGWLAGTYCWGIVGSHMKLVREGTRLHAELKKAATRKVKPAISSKSFVPGTVYRTASGKLRVYLGEYETRSIVDLHNGTRNQYINGRYEAVLPELRTKYWKGGLWIDFDRWGTSSGDYQQEWERRRYYQVTFANSKPKVVEVVGQVDLSEGVPAIIHAMADKQMEVLRADYQRWYSNSDRPFETHHASTIMGLAELYNVGEIGSGYIHPDLQGKMPPAIDA